MYTWRIGDRVLPLRRTRYHKVWVITAIRELPTSSAGVKLLEVRAEEQSSAQTRSSWPERTGVTKCQVC